MRFSTILLLAASAFPSVSFAVSYPGIEKNVVMRCGDLDSQDQVFVLSEKYTTKGYGQLEGDPGQMYTLPGRMNRTPENVYSIKSVAPLTPLESKANGGWFDKMKGIYENEDYRLDFHSIRESKIFLFDKKSGKQLSCYVEGDCC